MNLKTTQESIIQHCFNSHPADNFLVSLKPCGDLHPQQQLAIYQNNIRGALQTCLAQVYPVCRKILGTQYFKQLARGYINQYPSRHHDLNRYGEFFSDFIYIQQRQLRNELDDFPYLSDLVKLEWFYHQVYYAENSTLFDFSAFSQLSESQQAQSRFYIAPCLKFISSDYPILSIWQINQGDLSSQHTIDLKAENCCIFRNKSKIELFSIDSKVYSLLKLVSEGATLNEIVKVDDGNNFPHLIKQGWVDSFEVKHV